MAALQQRVVAEVDAGHHVGRPERHLLGLGKEVVGVAVQHHPAHHAQRHQFLGHQFGGVEHVETKTLGLLLGEHLQAQFPLGAIAAFDRLPKVAAVEVGVGAAELDRFVPHQRVRAGHRVPVELDEHRLAFGIYQPEGVHAKALHLREAARQGAVAHHPHQHVGGFGREAREVPEGVVRRSRLRHAVVGLGLDGMDEIGKLHCVLNEEHRDVVAHQVPVALVGIKLHREAAHVARHVGRASLAGHGGKAHEHRRALAHFGKRRGHRELRDRLGALEVTVCRRAARVHHALGNALVVEVIDLFAQHEVFEQRGAAQAGLERVLVVGNLHALVGGEFAPARIHAHAVQRFVAGVVPGPWLAAAELGGGDVFGHRAGGVAQIERRKGRAGRRRLGPVRADLAGLELVGRALRSQGLGADCFARQALLRRRRELGHFLDLGLGRGRRRNGREKASDALSNGSAVAGHSGGGGLGGLGGIGSGGLAGGHGDY